MKESKQRVGGVAINWITIVVQVAISLFFVPFFLTTVGDKQYGLYSFSTSIIAWIDTLMIAVASAYYKFLTREKSERGKKGEAVACGVFFKIFFFIAIGVLVIGIGFDILLYTNVIPLSEYSAIEKNQICLIILMSLLSTTIATFLTTSKSYPFYKEKYIFIYLLSLGQIILQAIISIIFLKAGFGVVYVAGAHFGTAILVTLIMSFVSKYSLKQKIIIKAEDEEDKKRRKRLTKEIIVFSSFVIVNTVVDLLNKSLDKTLLGFYNAYSVANYQLAYSIPSYLMSFTAIITVVNTQKVNDVYYNGGGLKEANNVFLRVSKLQSFVTFLIVGGFIACGQEFVSLWLDSSRMQVYYVACSLMLTYSLTCANGLSVIVRRLQNKHIKASFIYLGIAVANIGVSILLINLLGRENAIWGCVGGTIITYLVGHYIIMQIYDQKSTGINSAKFFLNFLIFGITAVLITVLITRTFELITINNTILRFFIKAVTYSIIFSAVLFMIDNDIKTSIKKILNRILKKKKKQTI